MVIILPYHIGVREVFVNRLITRQESNRQRKDDHNPKNQMLYCHMFAANEVKFLSLFLFETTMEHYSFFVSSSPVSALFIPPHSRTRGSLFVRTSDD